MRGELTPEDLEKVIQLLKDKCFIEDEVDIGKIAGHLKMRRIKIVEPENEKI